MPHLSRLASTLALALLAASAVHAASPMQPSTATTPSASTAAAQSPYPSAVGSMIPNGRRYRNPARYSSTGGYSSINGADTSAMDLQAAAAATQSMGAGGSPAAQYLGSGGLGFSAVDIARSFLNADANHDGELTEGEARRLSISMQSFQDMDRNFDGKVSRSEYEDSLR
jgi:hypothetical protein